MGTTAPTVTTVALVLALVLAATMASDVATNTKPALVATASPFKVASTAGSRKKWQIKKKRERLERIRYSFLMFG